MDRCRRAILARRPAVRLGLILGVVFGVAAAGYWTAMSLVPVSSRYLDSGRAFASQDLLKIGRALRASGIEHHIDDRKVEVSPDQYAQAMAAYAKLDVGPRPFDELRDPSVPGALRYADGASGSDAQPRAVPRRSSINLMASSRLWCRSSFPDRSSPRRPRAKPSAFVYLGPRRIAGSSRRSS